MHEFSQNSGVAIGGNFIGPMTSVIKTLHTVLFFFFKFSVTRFITPISASQLRRSTPANVNLVPASTSILNRRTAFPSPTGFAIRRVKVRRPVTIQKRPVSKTVAVQQRPVVQTQPKTVSIQQRPVVQQQVQPQFQQRVIPPGQILRTLGCFVHEG